MMILGMGAAGCCIILIACIYLAVTRQPKKDGKEDVVLKEPLLNLMPSLFLIAMCVFILGMRFAGFEVGGSETDTRNPDYYVVGLSLISALGAGYGILYSMLKQTLAYNDRMVCVDLLGRINTMRWDKVTEVKTRPMSRKITFYSGSETCEVNGEMKAYRDFVKLAKNKVPPAIASDTLDRLYSQYNVKK